MCWRVVIAFRCELFPFIYFFTEKIHELLGNLDDLPDELMTGFQDVGDLSAVAPQSGSAIPTSQQLETNTPQQLETNTNSVPGVQHFTSPVGGGVPGPQSHMYTNSPKYNSLNHTGGSVSPQPPVSISGDPAPSMPSISGTSSHSATPGPSPAPVQGRPEDPMGMRMTPSAGPHAMHSGGGQSCVAMMTSTPPNMALGMHGTQAMMQQGQPTMGNSHPMSYQMMSQHPSMANQHMMGMTQHGMVPEQYGMAGQPGMGLGHHMAQHGGADGLPSHNAGVPASPDEFLPSLPPRGAMQGYSQVQQMGMSPGGVHPGMRPMMNAQQPPNMFVPQAMGGGPLNMVASQGVGAQSNMVIPHGVGAQSNMVFPQGMGAQSNMVSSQGISTPPNMVAPQGVPGMLLCPGTPSQQGQQQQQQQDPLMSIDPTLRTSTGDFRMPASQSQQTQNDFVSAFTSSQQDQAQQDGLLGTQQSQVSITTQQQVGGDSQLSGMVSVYVCVVHVCVCLCACVCEQVPQALPPSPIPQNILF